MMMKVVLGAYPAEEICCVINVIRVPSLGIVLSQMPLLGSLPTRGKYGHCSPYVWITFT